MAKLDEDWKKFLDATQEEPEEVETDDSEDEPDDPIEDEENEAIDDDESEEEDADEDDDSEEEDDSKKAKKGKKEKSADDTYKPRLKQFLNDDGSLDAKKIEESYIQSGKQAVTLNKQVEELTESESKLRTDYSALLEAIKAKPDIAKALFGADGAKKLVDSPALTKKTEETNPLLKHLEAQMNNASNKAYEEFIKVHPEAVTDPEKARKIGSFMKIYGQTYREENNGEIASMKDALEAAYKYYGWDEKIKTKEDVAIAAKKAATTRSSGNAKKSATKKQAAMGEQFFAQKLGVKLKA